MLKPTPLVSRTHAPLCRLLSVSLAGTVPFVAPVLSVLLPTFDFCKAAHPVNATYRLGTSHAHITSDSQQHCWAKEIQIVSDSIVRHKIQKKNKYQCPQGLWEFIHTRVNPKDMGAVLRVTVILTSWCKQSFLVFLNLNSTWIAFRNQIFSKSSVPRRNIKPYISHIRSSLHSYLNSALP